MAALMLAEAACNWGAPLRAPPRPRPHAKKKLFSSGRQARLMSRICSTSVACLSASFRVVNVSSSILWYTREGMPLKYLSCSSRSPYPERSAGPLNSAENSAALYLCCCLIVEISEAGPEGGGKGRFVCEWGRGPLHSYLHRHELGEVGSGPGAGVSIEQAKCNLHLEFDGGQRRVDQPGRQRERTLLATRGMKDCLQTKATIVTVHWANFTRNECSSGLAAATAVKTIEEARRRGDVGQGLELRRGLRTTSWPKNAAECRGARSWEAFPATAPGRAGGSLEGSLKAVRLPQFF
ncbi:predicted protein [Postia placenta Mad-698-R]|uniref:Uncharacterized protein n=1 Tax=Postia placenta MAD-698-R-SB12 TaxID=670580 RepID=A0A1X6MIH1_9APHY|nr:hypothetical protein POSPLADRAFT_1160705 [Postia placenta MAD-698-R-SB12]EED85789.1 predicted protein [Postia placenta Mad-698-R]OSX56214.1 hypothetical protein POSPLADRAFT_1160705 [Postia placenta MAD-698-R-SB12]